MQTSSWLNQQTVVTFWLQTDEQQAYWCESRRLVRMVTGSREQEKLDLQIQRSDTPRVSYCKVASC